MYLNKSDLPYLFEDAGPWNDLSNGVAQQIVWEYSIVEGSVSRNLGEATQPMILETLRRKQNYRVGDYLITTAAVDAWEYLDLPDVNYAEAMLGYHGYWAGEIRYGDEIVLQPEVAVLLGLSPDLAKIPAYIETIPLDELVSLLDECQRLFADDDAIAFHKALPIETPLEAPNSMFDAMRRTRAQMRLTITRGRSDVLDLIMKHTGTLGEIGGWRIVPEEIARREALGLRP